MPNRDYAMRSKAKTGSNKLLIVLLILLLLFLSGLGLWFLAKTEPVSAAQPIVQEPQKHQLPSRPEETYSYIRELETREVPVDKNAKLVKLNAEQERQIKLRQEAEKQRIEQQTQLVQKQNVSQGSNVSETTADKIEPTAEQQSVQKAAEERRKQAELKKQQEIAKKAELEKQKAETQKVQNTKIVATAKPASEAPKSLGKYGLQCGAFKSKAQAENMQVRLAMAGYNARINSSAEWNRVVVGPVGDRAAASAAQSNARSVAECLIIGM